MTRRLVAAVLLILLACAQPGLACTQQTLQFFGPTPVGQLLQPAAAGTWMFPNAALSASTQTLWFNVDPGLGPWVVARWLVLWLAPSSNIHMRLVHMDDGPSNVTEIARFDSNGSLNPQANGVLVTTELNALAAGRVRKHLGYQLVDDGVTHATLYSVRLELVGC